MQACWNNRQNSYYEHKRMEYEQIFAYARYIQYQYGA